MNISELKSVLPTLLQHRIVAFLWGKQGIGKTQVVGQIAKEQGLDFRALYLGSCADVGDIIGLPLKQGDQVVHARPSWFPTSGSGIIFLDELNRAHPDIIQAMFQFVRTGDLHTHKLPPGWRIVAAGNYDSEDFTVTSTSDAAWNSRFCHVHVEPTPEEFILYAESKGAASVADFIRANPEMLEVVSKQRPELNVTPDRRSWLEMIAPLDSETMEASVRYELYSGIVGPTAAAAYKAHTTASQTRLTLKSILSNYGEVQSRVRSIVHKTETRFDLLSQPLAELETALRQNPKFLKKAQVVQLKQFMLDIPLELLAQTAKALGKLQFDMKNELLNDAELIKKL